MNKLFCISLSLSNQSLEEIKPITNLLELIAPNKGCFLHTTLFQGSTYSYKEILSWFNKGKSYLCEKSTISSLYNWDRYVKSFGKTNIDNYDRRYSAITLNYLNSDFLAYVSSEIESELSEHKLINRLSDHEAGIYQLEKNKPSFRYAMNYQYKAKARNVKAHTTLGLDSNLQSKKVLIDKFLNELKENSILHEGLYVSPLNEYCMPSNNESLKLCSLQPE